MIYQAFAFYVGASAVTVLAAFAAVAMGLVSRTTAARIIAAFAAAPAIVITCLVIAFGLVDDEATTSMVVGYTVPGAVSALFLVCSFRPFAVADITSGLCIGLLLLLGLAFILTAGLIYWWCVLLMVASVILQPGSEESNETGKVRDATEQNAA